MTQLGFASSSLRKSPPAGIFARYLVLFALLLPLGPIRERWGGPRVMRPWIAAIVATLCLPGAGGLISQRTMQRVPVSTRRPRLPRPLRMLRELPGAQGQVPSSFASQAATPPPGPLRGSLASTLREKALEAQVGSVLLPLSVRRRSVPGWALAHPLDKNIAPTSVVDVISGQSRGGRRGGRKGAETEPPIG